MSRAIVNLQAVLTTTRQNKLQAHVQWNIYNADTIGAISSVLSKEVSLLQGLPV